MPLKMSLKMSLKIIDLIEKSPSISRKEIVDNLGDIVFWDR